MFNYIKGTIALNECNYIVIDNNGIGYQVYVANPFSFETGKEYQVYLYSHIREDEFSLYGFKTLEEKELFMKLIGVKGLGPKMAMPMLATGSVAGIIDAIDRENILYLTKFPKIGDKVARQIILDLKGKITINSDDNTNDSLSELVEALEALGYKHADIKKVLPNITEEKLENQIKEALRLLLK